MADKIDYKKALLTSKPSTPGAGSSGYIPQSRAVKRSPPGLKFPAERACNHFVGPEDPYYVLILTNNKTFDELFTSKHKDIPERKKFVVHSLRLYQEPYNFIEQDHYNYEEDKYYGDEYFEISPGLSYKDPRKHRKHQYKDHGYVTGLSQTDYFNNIIKLYNHFNFNEKLRNVADKLVTTRREFVYNHHWFIVDTKRHREELIKELDGYEPGLCYALDAKGNKFDYEYFLYLNENFEIVNAPDHKKEECLKDVYIPVSERHPDFKLDPSEKA